MVQFLDYKTQTMRGEGLCFKKLPIELGVRREGGVAEAMYNEDDTDRHRERPPDKTGSRGAIHNSFPNSHQ